MHAIKGPWVGQTFALAKSNESGGRKARIRRSKEERKAMVESFIKKYQSTNNGNFPSLNLTHKEVGGSFYTIREIVREIIQENRVLGPGKLTEEEQNAEQFLEQHPLGSISLEPKSSQPASAIGIYFVPNHDQGVSDESVPLVEGLVVGSEKHKFDDEQIINGSAMYLKDETDKEGNAELEVNGSAMNLKHEADKEFIAELEVKGSVMALKHESDEDVSAELEANGNTMDLKDESDKKISVELEVNGSAMDLKDEIDKEVSAGLGVKELFEESEKELTSTMSSVTPILAEAEESVQKFTSSASKVTQVTTDIIVETFPLRPVSKPTDYMDERSSEVRNPSETIEEGEKEKVDVDPENGSFLLDGIISSENSSLVDDKEVGKDADLSFGKNSNLVYDKVADNFSDPPLETSKQLTNTDSAVHGSQNGASSKVDLSHNDISTSTSNERSKATDGLVINSPNSINPKSNGILTGKASGESTIEELILVDKMNKANVQHNANSLKTSNETLERINLKSWDGTAKKNVASETNPLLAFLRSFIAAFMNFWSE